MKYIYILTLFLFSVFVHPFGLCAQTVLTVPTGGGSTLTSYPHAGAQIVVNKGVMLPDTAQSGFLKYTSGVGLEWSDAVPTVEPTSGKGAHAAGNTSIYGSLTVTGATYLATTGGPTFLYGSLVNSFGAGKTVQEVTDATQALTLPSGTNGQVCYVKNADAIPTFGDAVIPSGETWAFVYANGWQHLK